MRLTADLARGFGAGAFKVDDGVRPVDRDAFAAAAQLIVEEIAASHAEGYQSEASGSYSHAEGSDTQATGNYGSHAEGRQTVAGSTASHAEGYLSQADGIISHAEGYGTRATNEAEHAEGKYNRSNTGTRHSVGIGTSDTARKNAVEVMDDGDVFIYGIGGYDGTNPETARTLQETVAASVALEMDSFGHMLESVTREELDAAGLTEEVLQELCAGRYVFARDGTGGGLYSVQSAYAAEGVYEVCFMMGVPGSPNYEGIYIKATADGGTVRMYYNG